MRRGIALLSVLLVLTALRCMATCIVSDAAATVPPCHRHHAPCQNHPGVLAYSVHQPSAHIDASVNLFSAVFEPAPLRRAANGFADTPALPRPEALTPIVLRI